MGVFAGLLLLWAETFLWNLAFGASKTLRELHKLTEEYTWLQFRFPGSRAVMSPFTLDWRPSLGVTDIGEDQRLVMQWADRVTEFLSRYEYMTKNTFMYDIARTRVLVPFDGNTAIVLVQLWGELAGYPVKKPLGD